MSAAATLPTGPSAPAPVRLPAAAASAVLPWLSVAGAGSVVGVLSAAVLIDLDGRVVAVLDDAATGVPNGIRVPGRLPEAAVGDRVDVAAGRLRLPAAELVVARTWPSRVPRIAVSGAALAATVAALDATLAAAADPDHDDAATPAGSPADLIGRGAGLTPAGDDVLCGRLAGLHAAGRPADAAALAADVARVLARRAATTDYSATLLRLAAAGHASTEVLDVLRAVNAMSNADPAHDRAAEALVAATGRLCLVGHTSGVALARGLLAGLGAGLAAGLAASTVRGAA